MIRNVIYIVLALFILSCEQYEADIGAPQVIIHDAASFDNSTIDVSWEGNEYASDYSYRLQPLDYADTVDTYTSWSEWSIDTTITLQHLDEGNYNFYVKSRFNIDSEESSDTIFFTIDAIGGPALRIYPLYQAVSSGSSSDIYLYVEEVVGLVGMELDISYNTAVISGIEISRGEFLTNSATFFPLPEYGDGVIRIIASPENFTALNGDGAVAKLTFTVSGSDTLSFLQSSVFKDTVNHSIEILERVEGIIEVVE